MTFLDLSNLVLSLAFPRRFSPSMLPLKKHLVKHGLTEIQRHIERFQEGNMDVIEGASELAVSGATVIDAPDGRVIQIAVGRDDCKALFATLSSHLHLQKMQQAFSDAYDCGDAEIPPFYPTSSVYWARDDKDLLIYPWVPCDWSIGIRWRGIKREWADDTEIWWADKVVETLRRYLVAWDKEGCEGFGDLLTLYRDELANLKAEQFHVMNPTQYDPYTADFLFPRKCPTHCHDDATATPVGAT